MLDRLAVLSRKQLHVRSAISRRDGLPGAADRRGRRVLALMLLFVLPRFAGLFETLDVELPPMTKVLMACSDLLRPTGGPCRSCSAPPPSAPASG
jgi:hypothetical protein